MAEKGKEEYIINWFTDLPYKYAIGKLAVKFFEVLKAEKKILGSQCPKCKKVNYPPRAICAKCMVEMTIDDMIEISPKGTLTGFTVVNYPFIDPQTGVMRPFPYGYAFIKLDGADTYMMHFVNETDHTKLRNGMRVEAVFKEEREGNFGDIPYFKVVEE